MPILLELAFGPVQDFIASARRTADLWAGSHLLSESARRAGQSLLDSGATLIYPDPGRVRDRGSDQSNVSNVLLAELPDGLLPTEVAERAIAAARTYLTERAEAALAEFPQLRKSIFRAQIQDALEAYAAWADYPLGSSYREAYKALKTGFSQRKNTRDFLPSVLPGAVGEDLPRLPKNSLDGLRETVLPEWPSPNGSQRGKWRKLHLRSGEHLDALGVLKRLSGKDNEARFAALTRIAAHDWLQGLPDPVVRTIADAYETLVPLGVASRCPDHGGGYTRFLYDGALLFPERLQVARKESEDCDDPQSVAAALDRLLDVLKPVWRRHGQPLPYAAVLVADGDRMGKFVAAAENPEHHRRLTLAIAGFADRAIGILRDNGGQAIYAGGEDVLGFLPLSGVLRASRALAGAFSESIAELTQELQELGRVEQPPTLRVGVAIAHIQQPLGYIRHLADGAEKLAKGAAGSDHQGNALGLRLHVRAGHMLSWRLPFDPQNIDDFQALERWIRDFGEGRMATAIGYDIRALGLRLRLQRLPGGLVVPEIARLLDKAQQQGGRGELAAEQREALLSRLAMLRTTHGDPGEVLCRLGEELILSRWLSAHQQGDILGAGYS